MSSKIKGKKVGKKKGKKIPSGDNNAEQNPVFHDFWMKAPEDLLLEIFIRLPDFRSAIQCSTVCRLWHSLIISNPQFIPRFRSHNPLLSSHTIIFHGIYRPIFQTFSEEWMFLHGKLSTTNFLDSIPRPMHILASCNDLLLVSSSDALYLCKPNTKQYVRLPDIPEPADPAPYSMDQLDVGHGLICVPPSPSTTNIKFKVVQVILPHGTFPLTVTVFCSESRKWEKKNFHYSPFEISFVYRTIYMDTCNGILYLRGDKYGPDIVYLDLLKGQGGVIEFPPSYSWDGLCRIGVVCVPGGKPELRLMQVISNPGKACVHVNVWRLDYNNDGDTNWFSVHNKQLKGPTNMGTKQQKYDCQPFLHPTNCSLVFLLWDESCFQFNLRSGKYKEIDKTTLAGDVTKYFLPLPMVFSYGCLANLDF